MSSVQDTQSVDFASFEAVRSYDWAADHEFQVGLQSILSSASSPEQAATLAQRAKCFFYSKKSGTLVDYGAFDAWLAKQEPAALDSTKSEPEPEPEPASASASALEAPAIASSHERKGSASILGRPSIDATNPVVNSENFPANAPSKETSSDSASPAPVLLVLPVLSKVEASYPTSFAHIVELISTGQPIPGIREIPNELNSAPPSEATKPKRRKPWEIATDSTNGNVSSTVGIKP